MVSINSGGNIIDRYFGYLTERSRKRIFQVGTEIKKNYGKR